MIIVAGVAQQQCAALQWHRCEATGIYNYFLFANIHCAYINVGKVGKVGKVEKVGKVRKVGKVGQLGKVG